MKRTLVMILTAAMLFTAGCAGRPAPAEEAPAVTETPVPTPDPEEALRLEEEKRAAAYADAEALFEAGDYENAAAAFEALGGYSDSAERAEAARTALMEAALNA